MSFFSGSATTLYTLYIKEYVYGVFVIADFMYKWDFWPDFAASRASFNKDVLKDFHRAAFYAWVRNAREHAQLIQIIVDLAELVVHRALREHLKKVELVLLFQAS